jgi:hypothetical protein
MPSASWTIVYPANAPRHRPRFAANTVAWWAPQIRTGDVVRWPYGAVETAPIDERDIAAVAVRALSEASLASGT